MRTLQEVTARRLNFLRPTETSGPPKTPSQLTHTMKYVIRSCCCLRRMSGICAAPLNRLITLMVDAGAAYYHLDEETLPAFVIYVPLLGELTHKDTRKVITDLKRTTRPFLQCIACEVGLYVHFNEITELYRFEAAVVATLGDLPAYECAVGIPAEKRAETPSFPVLSVSAFDEGSVGECIRRVCVAEVSHAASRVRKLARPLTATERSEFCRRVMPEYEPVVREAEQLALRIVRMDTIVRARRDPVESHERDEWLRDCGYMSQPLIRPIRGERCDTECKTALVSHAISGLAIATSVTPEAAK